MKMLKRILLLTMMLAALTACAAEDPGEDGTAVSTLPPASPTLMDTVAPPEEMPADTNLAGADWRLESYGPVGNEMPALDETAVTLNFDDVGQAGGNSGCNSYGGEYGVQGDALLFGEIVSTLMACADDDVTAQEQAFLDALRAAETFTQTEDRLTIYYDGGQSALQFVQADAPPSQTTEPYPGVTATPGDETGYPVGDGSQLSETAQTYVELSQATLAQGLRIPADQITLASITEPASADGVYVIMLAAEGETYTYHGRDENVTLVSEPLPPVTPTP